MGYTSVSIKFKVSCIEVLAFAEGFPENPNEFALKNTSEYGNIFSTEMKEIIEGFVLSTAVILASAPVPLPEIVIIEFG